MVIYPVFYCFLVSGGITIWNLTHFQPNEKHCSKGMYFTTEYVFFVSGSGLLLSNILFDYDHFPNDIRTRAFRTLEKSNVQRWQQVPPISHVT